MHVFCNVEELTNRRWGRSIILEEIGLQYFSHTQGCLIKSFVSLRFRKFLEFTQGPLQGRSPPPLTPHSCTASPLLLPQTSSRACPPECNWGGRTLTEPLSNVRDHIFTGVCRSCLPQHSPIDPTPGMTQISQQAPTFFHPFSISHLAPPPSKIWVGNSV